uniref:Uncharacterized protein n=1 Tax=Ceratitis capitata TaxID=7213 RepID=W8BYW6_CERCA
MTMLPRLQLLLLAVIITVISKDAKLTSANVLFRFAFDFHVKSGNDSTETHDGVFNKTWIFENNHITVKNNLSPDESVEEELISQTENAPSETSTVGPLRSMADFWAQQRNLNSATDRKLREIVNTLTKMNQEITTVVGRSDFVASKVKLITRYLNILDAAAAEEFSSNLTTTHTKFDYLRKFIKLADKLKEPPAGVEGGERTLDYVLMKMALDKYRIAQLRVEVDEQVTVAEDAWQQYVKSKLVEVDV